MQIATLTNIFEKFFSKRDVRNMAEAEGRNHLYPSGNHQVQRDKMVREKEEHFRKSVLGQERHGLDAMCPSPGLGESRREASPTMEGLRKGMHRGCSASWSSYTNCDIVLHWSTGNECILDYKDNQSLLNNPRRICGHEFKLESVSRNTRFSPDLFSCQQEIRGLTRVRVF